MGADHAMDPDASRHPGMHKTDTVDYAIVLSGEIWALMDEGETLLKAGDCLVQRGTNHAWSNRSNQPCLVAFILISAQPHA
jgi:quercetin dioxygenase-like cupin family protein